MLHKHQWARVSDIDKPGSASSMRGMVQGVLFVCMDDECDGIRKVWADGSKETVREGLPTKDELE